MTSPRALELLAVVAAISSPAILLAQTGPPDPEVGPRADEARGLVDPDSATASDVALAVPRTVLAVPRLVFDAAALPIKGAIRLEDDHHVVSWLEDLFYNDERTAAIIPFASFETYLGPGAGVIAFHDDLFGHHEQIRGSARFAGTDNQAYQLSFAAGQTTSVATLARYESSSSLRFEGIGAGGPPAHFGQDRVLGLLRLGQRLGDLQLTATGVYIHRKITDGDVAEHYDTMQINGFGETIDTLELLLGVNLQEGPFRLEAFGGGVPAGASYIHWGVEGTGRFELWAPGRELYLRTAVEGVDGDDVPFTDLPRLGGPGRLRGYARDRFRGTTAEMATIEYRYPVHQYVAGAVFLDAGHVTDNDWRAGGGLGLVVHSKDRPILNMDVAYGDGFTVVFSTDPLRAFAKRDTEL